MVHLRAGSTAAPVPAAGRRWLARLAFVAAGLAMTLIVLVGLLGGLGLMLTGVACAAISLAAAWWFLTHRGLVRVLAGVVVVVVPLTVAIVYVVGGLVWAIVAFEVLWAGAVAAGRRALRTPGGYRGPRQYETPPPRRPYLIMNPRSGDGKVGRFRLVERARELGAEVALLDPGADLGELADRAVREGADLLGVAAGDGTQAWVAGIAAQHGLPFLVISAGTRNHFALDLGLDVADPATCLDALTDGVEVRIDLGRVAGRPFVNNASFGAYAAVVQSPAYRADKTRTALEMLPELLAGGHQPPLRLRVGDRLVIGPQAVLVSNNPYGSGDVGGLGRRPRLDTGMLGVLAVTVRSGFEAAGLLRRHRSKSLFVRTAADAVVEADEPSIPVGVDGEALMLPTPVHCAIRPGALRVRVPRQRPGIPVQPELDWARLRELALSTGRG